MAGLLDFANMTLPAPYELDRTHPAWPLAVGTMTGSKTPIICSECGSVKGEPHKETCSWGD